METTAVCLLSGGLDSCVATRIAQDQGYSCHTLSFDYGQHHRKELEQAKQIAKALHVQKHTVFTLDLAQFGGSALFNHHKTVPHTPLQDIGKQIPPTYVPGRNTIFLTIALAYAETLQAQAVVIGANSRDYSGYPDCRPEYFQAFQQLANVATKQAVEGNPVQILTPLLHLSKAEIIKKGHALQAPFHLTWSCYQGQKRSCGNCESCQLRLQGFEEAGIPDPLPYVTYPSWYTLIKK